MAKKKKKTLFEEGINEGGRPPVFETPEEMQEKIIAYFEQYQNQTENRPTITGLALYLGFASRQSLYDYKGKEGFSYIVKRSLMIIENEYEKRLTQGNVTGVIFALKNMNWKDKQEIEQTQTEYKVTVTKEEALQIKKDLEGEI